MEREYGGQKFGPASPRGYVAALGDDGQLCARGFLGLRLCSQLIPPIKTPVMAAIYPAL